MMNRLIITNLTALLTLISLMVGGVTPAAAKRRKRKKYTWVVSGKANINNASVKKLRCLPGIGTSKAKAIVAHRRRKPFTSLSQLRAIRGIGKKLFGRIRRYVTLKGATTIARKRMRRPRK